VIDYGIEQFDNHALKAMNKRQTEKQVLRAVELTLEVDITVAFKLIWGNLGDT
jgi:hypothetical protein